MESTCSDRPPEGQQPASLTPDQTSPPFAEVAVQAPDSIVVPLRTLSKDGCPVTNLEKWDPSYGNCRHIGCLLDGLHVVVGGDAAGLNYVAVGTENDRFSVTPELTRESLARLSSEETIDLMRKICRIAIYRKGLELTQLESGDVRMAQGKGNNINEEEASTPDEVAKEMAEVRARIQAYQKKLEELES